jgi:hypothetical protein
MKPQHGPDLNARFPFRDSEMLGLSASGMFLLRQNQVRMCAYDKQVACNNDVLSSGNLLRISKS